MIFKAKGRKRSVKWIVEPSWSLFHLFLRMFSYGRNSPKCKSEAQLRCHRQFSQRNQVSHTSCTGCAAHPETTQGWYGASEHNRNGQWAWNTRKSLHSWAKGVAANRLGIAAFILHICCPGGNITVIFSLLGSLNTAIRVPKDHSMSWNV